MFCTLMSWSRVTCTERMLMERNARPEEGYLTSAQHVWWPYPRDSQSLPRYAAYFPDCKLAKGFKR